jgi:hypothetical protein
LLSFALLFGYRAAFLQTRGANLIAKIATVQFDSHETPAEAGVVYRSSTVS